MFEVDRVVAIVRPTAKLLDWLRNLPEPIDNLVIENLQKDCTVLLIPRFDGPRQAEAYIHQIYQGIFEGELAMWGVQKKFWPEQRDEKQFAEWFHIEFHSMIYDVAFLEEKRNSRRQQQT